MNKNMLKQVQKMQNDMMKAQEEIYNTTFESSVQNLVKVAVNGKKEVLKVEIDPEILSADEKEMVEDLVVTALNQALRDVDRITEQKMGAFTKGFNIPGLF